MLRFSRVCQRIESVPFHRDKTAILARYLEEAPETDRCWALYLLLGGQLPRVLEPRALEQWIARAADLPEWLLQECREQTGDLAETAALLGELGSSGVRVAQSGFAAELSLTDWIEKRIRPLALANESEREAEVSRWWRDCGTDVAWAAVSLALGKFPVRVPRKLAEDANPEPVSVGARLAQVAGVSGLRARGEVAQMDFFA